MNVHFGFSEQILLVYDAQRDPLSLGCLDAAKRSSL